MEIWKEVKGYEGKYEVSNCGNVRSMDRVERFRNGTRKRLGRLMKQRVFNGYLTVALKDYNNGNTKFVHRLVAEAFLGNVNGLVVDHIDFNPLNNKVENLRITTQKDNILRSVSQGRHNFGEKHGMSKLTENDVKALRSAERGTIAGLCRKLGIKYATGKTIRRGETWAHVK